MFDEKTLRRLYLEEQLSIRAIAELKQVPTRTIYDALIQYRIPRRPAKFRSSRAEPIAAPFDEASLRRLYVGEERSIRDIAALYQVSTRMVYDALSHYRIPRRTSGFRQPSRNLFTLAGGTIDQVALRRLYEEQGLSIAAIAAEAQCSPSWVRNALVRWGIARRRRGRRYSAEVGGWETSAAQREVKVGDSRAE
jgi:predicted DNA-binding protein YlxM (UPF0122 family)